MAETLNIPARVSARPARVERPSDLNYAVNIAQRITAGLVMCRMDMIGTTTSPRKPYEVAERIALIEICGVLCNDPCWWDETGYDEIQNEVSMAADDSDVDAMLLIINSPGGETDNAFETHDLIKKAADVKPIYAVAAPMAYSSGYLMASPANKIYMPPTTGGVGSIGVYGLHLDFSGYLEQAGIKPTFISAGTGKVDGNPYEPLSASARESFVLEIQRLYGEFVARVASGRNMGESAIIKLGAALFAGSKSGMGAGLADRAGSVEQAWIDLATRVVQDKHGISATAGAIPKGETMADTTPAAAGAGITPAAAAAPAVDTERLMADARAAGYTQAAEVVDLCTLAGKPEAIGGFIGAKTSVADVRAALLKQKAEANEKAGEVRGDVLPYQAADAAKPRKSMKEIALERYGEGNK